MSEYIELHPVTPQLRLIRRAAEIVRAGGVIAYPTDSCYALGCHIGDMPRARARAAHPQRGSAPSFHAGVPRPARDRALRAHRHLAVPAAARPATPGPYHVPAAGHARDAAAPAARASAAPSASACPIIRCRACCCAELGEPLMSSTLLLPGDAAAADRRATRSARGSSTSSMPCSMAGDCGIEPTTVIDLAVSPPVVVRARQGQARPASTGNCSRTPYNQLCSIRGRAARAGNRPHG